MEASLDETVLRYRERIRQAAAGSLVLEDRDLDTGLPIRWGESGITQRTYARLLEELGKGGFQDLPDGLRADVLAYFEGSDGAPPPKTKPKKWQQTLARLEQLRGTRTGSVGRD